MELSDAEEARHHAHILRAFNAYRYQHLAGNNLRRQAFANLSTTHQSLLPDQKALLTASTTNLHHIH
jgi:hypothetical protein